MKDRCLSCLAGMTCVTDLSLTEEWEVDRTECVQSKDLLDSQQFSVCGDAALLTSVRSLELISDRAGAYLKLLSKCTMLEHCLKSMPMLQHLYIYEIKGDVVPCGVSYIDWAACWASCTFLSLTFADSDLKSESVAAAVLSKLSGLQSLQNLHLRVCMSDDEPPAAKQTICDTSPSAVKAGSRFRRLPSVGLCSCCPQHIYAVMPPAP